MSRLEFSLKKRGRQEDLTDRLSKLGDASLCLRVTVTDDELWIALHPPFNIVADRSDLEHRISKEIITHVDTKRRRSVIVDFSLNNSEAGRVELYLRRPKDFIEALGLRQV